MYHLVQDLTPWSAPEVTEGVRKRMGLAEDLRTIMSTHRVVMGHYRAEEMCTAGANQLVAVVREPRLRIISNYTFWCQKHRSGMLTKQGPYAPAMIDVAEGGFDKFLRTPAVARDVDNVFVLWLLRSPANYHLLADPYPTTEHVQRAWELCEHRDLFTGVFWQNETVEAMAHLGLRSKSVPAVINMSEPLPTGEEISPQVIERLNEVTRADFQLLDLLMEQGLLKRRSQEEFDQEFYTTLKRSGMTITTEHGSTDGRR
jgi:hypothetical protein